MEIKSKNDDYEKDSDEFTHAMTRALGNDIKRMREEMQLTQPQLAERLCMELRNLQKIEGGKVGVQTLMKIMYRVSVLSSKRQMTTDYTADDNGKRVANRFKAILSNIFSNEEDDK